MLLRLVPIRRSVDLRGAFAGAAPVGHRAPADPDARSRILRSLEGAEQPLTALFARSEWPGPDAA